MNGEELLEALEEFMDEHEVSQRDMAWEDYEDSFRDLLVQELGEFEIVQGPERTEGDGAFDGAQCVYFFPAHNTYISFEGYYTSDNGMTFGEGMQVVEPVEVTTTVYSPKK